MSRTIKRMVLWTMFTLGLPWQVASAQTPLFFEFVDAQLTGGQPLRLEAFEYRPANWNGKVIVMSHGSTGGKREVIKSTFKFLNISKEAIGNGYVFVTYMRKGRGNSEGSFTEETGRCDRNHLSQEKREAELQLAQVIDQVRKRYGVHKVILMGHSRGGFLSATYAAKNPEHVLAVVNLAGTWSAVCEGKNGNQGRLELEEAAKRYQPQFWAYFDKDTYFAEDRFNDPEYRWFTDAAARHGVTFSRFDAEGMSDGHATPTFKPGTWARAFFPKLNALK